MAALLNVLLVAAGIAMLYWGGDALVKHATRLARFLGMSPLVVGLTVVSFGTSSPELLTTLTATFKQAPDVAMGNVVGSNLANLGLVLGLSAAIYPLRTQSHFIRREVPFTIFTAALLLPLSRNLSIGRPEGLLLVALLALYLWVLLRYDSNDTAAAEFSEAYGDGSAPLWRSVLGVILGIALLVAGAQTLISGALQLAELLGVSGRIVGLSVVALSTSLPELASSLVAAWNKQGDILVGNLIGSNIFNTLAILGITALVNPITISPQIARVDLWLMVGLSALVWPFLSTKLRLERWEGAILGALYVAYLVFVYGGG